MKADAVTGRRGDAGIKYIADVTSYGSILVLTSHRLR